MEATKLQYSCRRVSRQDSVETGSRSFPNDSAVTPVDDQFEQVHAKPMARTRTDASVLVLDRRSPVDFTVEDSMRPFGHRTSCLYELVVLEVRNQADSPTVGGVVEDHQIFDLLSDSPQ